MSCTNNVYVSPRVTLVITGASRGFGASLVQAFVEEYARQFGVDNAQVVEGKLRVVLIARDLERLQSVAQKMKAIMDEVEIHLVECDFSKPFDEHQIVPESMLTDTEHCILVHNVGQVGRSDLRCIDIASDQRAYRDEQVHLNLYSMMELTAGVMKNIRKIATDTSKRLDVINISSLAALQPFPGMLDYCMLKRAREAYTEQLAKELENDHSLGFQVRILNYAPGPLETDMLEEIRQKALLRQDFSKLEALEPIDSARRMMYILKKDAFPNAQHIDFYDVQVDC